MLEGGHLAGGRGAPAPPDPAEAAARPPGNRIPRTRRSRLWPWVAALVAVAIVVLGVLALAGAFSSGGDSASTGVAAYKTAIRGYCRLALSGVERNAGGTARQRAGSYLEVIETMRGRLQSLPPPTVIDRALERFRSGLTSAADFTSVVAQAPPPPGTPAEANVVAELTFAAGQVQAGALGYDLGPSCVAIGDLVSRSAGNAAQAP